jgi:tRNA pseudouridine55 synthase
MTAMSAESLLAGGQDTVDGLLLLDKPLGMSSNAALQAARKLFGRIKGGHTGTLDPLASGLLPLCFGVATKFAAGLLEADKTYDAIIQLGVATTTGDAEGAPILEASPEACMARVPEVLGEFTGDVEQVPPMFSAIKHRGRPLYQYARAGQTVERDARRVKVYSLELLSTSGAEVSVRVRCSKGTYIRTLAHDIGLRLGCGAHLRALRRTGIGEFKIEEALALERLAELTERQRIACLRSADVLLVDLPAVVVDRAQAAALLQGQAVARPAPAGSVRLYAEDGLFLGLGAAREGLLLPKRMWVRSRTTAAVANADVA